MKRQEFLNFMGDTQNYKIRPVPPNPYGMRGNPDEFDWAMDQGGDGLNGTPEYRGYDGEYYPDEVWSNHPGFIGGFGEKVGNLFKRKDTKMITLSDGSGGTTQYSWGDIKADENLMNLYTAQKDLKSQKRKAWWSNLGNNLGTFGSRFSSSYGATQQGTNPLLVPPSGVYTPPQTTTETTQAGPGAGKIIGWVLVGGVVLALVIYAMSSGKQSKTIVVQQPSPVK